MRPPQAPADEVEVDCLLGALAAQRRFVAQGVAGMASEAVAADEVAADRGQLGVYGFGLGRRRRQPVLMVQPDREEVGLVGGGGRSHFRVRAWKVGGVACQVVRQPVSAELLAGPGQVRGSVGRPGVRGRRPGGGRAVPAVTDEATVSPYSAFRVLGRHDPGERHGVLGNEITRRPPGSAPVERRRAGVSEGRRRHRLLREIVVAPGETHRSVAAGRTAVDQFDRVEALDQSHFAGGGGRRTVARQSVALEDDLPTYAQADAAVAADGEAKGVVQLEVDGAAEGGLERARFEERAGWLALGYVERGEPRDAGVRRLAGA